jgi:hypothetical protein
MQTYRLLQCQWWLASYAAVVVANGAVLSTLAAAVSLAELKAGEVAGAHTPSQPELGMAVAEGDGNLGDVASISI